MLTEAQGSAFLSNRPTVEFFGLEYSGPARSSRGIAAFFLMSAWIAIVDVCWPRTNLSILYVIPLLVTAWTGDLQPLRRSVGLPMLLTYVGFVSKYLLYATSDDYFFNYALFNRTLTVVMLSALGCILVKWIDWRREQLLDSETPEYLRRQDREVSATLAMLCCAPLVTLIAAIDFLVPANYNLAILYPIPLYICGWTSNRRLLWSMLAVLLVLTAVAFEFGPTATDVVDERSMVRNRVLAAIGMVGVSVVLSLWMRDDPRD
jgi:hypothetical protein